MNVRALLVGGIACLFITCSDDGPSGPGTPPAGAPNHTLRVGGAYHLEGHRDPETNCVLCHGADLRGGDQGEPSCFSCHGREW